MDWTSNPADCDKRKSHQLIASDNFVKNISALCEKSGDDDDESAYRMLQDFLSAFVPKIYKPNTQPTDSMNNEDESDTGVLSDTFMNIMCGGPGVTFEEYGGKLNITRARPGQICGRLFRNGEPTYSCKECATDPTCVMCFDCFSRSEHKAHKYKMHASGGSGYCDCGDPEAWKRDAYCSRHAAVDGGDGAAGGLIDGTSELLPEVERRRMRRFIACILRYSVELLCWDYSDILPAGLTMMDSNVPYQTMLFNDESHTYDQVIKALTKAIDCDEERAMLLATVVDREGRSSVRFGPKEDCERAKAIIQQRTARESKAPLIVETMDSNLVAHQQCAIKILHWLTSATTVLPPLVNIVAKILMREKFIPSDGDRQTDQDTYVTKLMKRDFKLWKSARSSAHELLMGTVLMDTEMKKEFAKLFVRMYPDIMQKHIDDDHEHILSITALTVQIFTVPTIARLLIADENALFHVIYTFFGKASRHITSKGRFSFQRASHATVLRRSLYALCDARYLLTVPPGETEWTGALRRNFCVGVKALLDILLCMQGMDEVVRQVAQHQEWEPEWETAFNIQIRLTPIVSQIQRWTKNDKECLTTVFNETMAKLYHFPDVAFLTSVAKCGDHQAECIVYDVSKRPVSIHLPLTRLLAALYLNFSSFGLRLTSPEVNSADSTLSVERLIELPLRTLVMIAQSSAGMWRRNGYSLINQIHNYLSPLCRSEMFDRDVLMLQIGAANMQPNEFMVRVLDKFNLLSWASPIQSSEGSNGEEESVKQTVTIAEEFLHLMVMITGERWNPGVGEVTKDEAIRREVIHILCKGPAAYSKLDKHLPEDHLERTGLEQVIRQVADFRKPTGTNAGVFELKAACRGEYNSFFYHYSKIDFSKAEQLQRKERRDDPLDIRACPPPLPPQFTDAFGPVVNVFSCDVMLQILTNVLKRAKSYGRFHTNGQLHRALHLISLALLEEIRQHGHNWRKPSSSSSSADTDRVFSRFVFTTPAVEFAKAKRGSTILELMEGLLGQAQTQYYQDLLRWMITKYKEASAMHAHPPSGSSDQQLESTVEISMDPSDDPGGGGGRYNGNNRGANNDDGEQERKRRRREIAMKQRQRAMEQMTRLQKDFMKNNRAFFEHSSIGGGSGRKPGGADGTGPGSGSGQGQGQGQEVDPEEMETELGRLSTTTGTIDYPTALGPAKSELVELATRRTSCVLCQEGQEVTFAGRAVVYAAFVQTSALFSKARGRIIENPEKHDPLYAPADLHAGVLTSTCGHTMHWDCWQKFYDSVVSKEQRRPLRWRFSSFFDVDNGEYLCPLCKRLSNTVLPVLPPLKKLNFDSSEASDVPYKDWLSGLETAVTVANQRPAPVARASTGGGSRKVSRAMSGGSSTGGGSVSLLSGLSWHLPSTSRSRSSTTSSSSSSSSSVEPMDVGQQPANPTAAAADDVASFVGVSFVADLLPTYNSVIATLTQNMPSSVVDQLSRVWRHLSNFNEEMPMSTSYFEMLRTFSQSVYSHGLKVAPFHDSPRAPIMSWSTTAFTVRSIDACLTFDQKPLFGAFSARQRDCLYALVRYGAVCNLVSKPVVIRRHLIRLLQPFLTTTGAGNNSSPTVLELDLFTTLVELTYAIGWLHADEEDAWTIPIGGVGEFHVFRLVLSAYVLQLVLPSSCASSCWTTNGEEDPVDQRSAVEPAAPAAPGADGQQRETENRPEQEPEQNQEEQKALDSLMTAIRNGLYSSPAAADGDHQQMEAETETEAESSSHFPPPPVVSSSVRRTKLGLIRGFLRPAALFYHALTHVPPPEALKDPSIDEYGPLCRFLGMPGSFAELMTTFIDLESIQKWCSHPRVKELVAKKQLVAQPISANLLIPLPYDFCDLINKAAVFNCPSLNSDESRSPTMCLSCGALLCSQSYCCQKTLGDQQVGACTFHANSCTADTGVFLKVRDCQIVLLFEQHRGCILPAPYVDEYGETDPGFRRGYPLHLNRDLYRRLQLTWLQQNVPEQIVNKMELAGTQWMAQEWQHL